MLKKLTITAYKDPGYSQQAGDPYEVSINPEKYEHSYSIEYNKADGAGSPGSSPKFEKVAAEKVKFQLIFDATGVVDGASTDLPSEIQKFKGLVYDYDGSIHSPYFVELSWGTALFKGRLTSMQINYTLFKPDGTPLRAEVNTDFEEYIDARTIARIADKQSPDLTHIRQVKDGDTLPLLCYDIYGDSSLYIQVAKQNKLSHFRDLKAGSKLLFPPLKK